MAQNELCMKVAVLKTLFAEFLALKVRVSITIGHTAT